MFANHRLAFAAAEMEVHEAKARLLAQNQLAAAQAQAAQRKLVSSRLLRSCLHNAADTCRTADTLLSMRSMAEMATCLCGRL